MHIEIPSGKVFLDGHLVKGNRNLYIEVNGVKSVLSEAEKQLAREMRRAFAPLIEKGA